MLESTVGALMVIIGFGGILYYNYNKEPAEVVLVILEAPILEAW